MTTRKKPTASLRLVEQVFTEQPDQLKALVKAALEEVLQADMTEALGALPGQRSDGRLGYRAGYYTRGLVTRIGKLELRVPRDRTGQFSTELFERYQRSEKALVSALAEMYVQGVSTRKVKVITEELCGHSFSASTISQINKGLDATLQRFAERPLEEPYPYLVLDARYEKVRLDGVIRAQAVLIAIGINWEGRRNVLGVELALRESTSAWKEFLTGLKARGLAGVEFVVADDHAGLRRALVEAAARGGLPALLRSLPAQRSRLPATQGRRRLPAGTALALRAAQPRRGPGGPGRLAQALGEALSEAHRLGREPDRRDPHLLPPAAATPQTSEEHQSARATQRGDPPANLRGANLPERAFLPALGARPVCRDPRELDRGPTLSQHEPAQRAEEGTATRRCLIQVLSYDQFAQLDGHNPSNA